MTARHDRSLFRGNTSSRFILDPQSARRAAARRTALYVVITAVVLAAVNRSSPARAQDVPRRLDEIETRLKQLLNDVQTIRSNAGQPTASPAKSDFPPKTALPESWIKSVHWRAIGPANMGGRIVDMAVLESDPSTFWVATASGGLLKTVNNGITFEHQFDREATVSIGAVAVAPSDGRIVWVGTGEGNPRNSVSYGDGVYKSTDGGKSWKNMGLGKTFQIGRIVIHPKNPDIVYVGALGRLYGTNEDRGVFKTADGGKTWQKVLFIDDKTGVIEMEMHPTDPETLIAATWERLRDGFDSWPGRDVPIPDGYDGYDPIKKWGPGSGLHKTTDGGKTWRKLTKGLPTGAMGRIGIDWYAKNPNVLYAVVDCENIGKGPPPLSVYLGLVGENIDGKARLTQVQKDSPAAKAGLQPGDILDSVEDKAVTDFDQLLDAIRPKRPGQKVKLKATRGSESKDYEITLAPRPGQQAPAAAGLWLGVQGETRDNKAVITQIIPNGPAAGAGLNANDVVLSVDGAEVKEFDKLIETIRGKKAGDKIKLKVARGDQTPEVTVTLEERPATGRGPGPTAQPTSNVYMGIQGEDAAGGAKMNVISEDSPAERGGMKAGDLVTAVDGKPLAGYQALVELLREKKPGDKLKLTVRRGEATVELEVTLDPRADGPSRTRPYFASLGGQAMNAQDQQGAKGFEYGGIYKSTDGGESWTRVNSVHSRPMYFSVVRVDPNDDQRVYLLGVPQFRSSNGGETFTDDLARGVHADGHVLWIDPRDGRHMILGVDGGTYVTYDRGAHWDHLNHSAIGQFYHVAISRKHPYALAGGLQDNGTWMGPSIGLSGTGPINEDWVNVGGGDGFMCQVDPDDPDLVYYTSQNGAMARRNFRTGERAAIRPARVAGAPTYRFNWNTPFILSNHNSKVFYCAGDYVFRSLNKGDNLQVISPQITLTKRGSATALAESSRNSDVLYVGTDDGALWGTRDGGRQWTDLTKFIGLPAPRWVATIETSRFVDGRVYITLDGHRSDDDEPYVFVSDDFGHTWRSLRANLPWGSTRVLREDLQNPNVLYLGTEFGVWISIDRGQHWNKLNANLPTVAVHELAQHPTRGELVAATHGRSLWICDVSALRRIQPTNLAGDPVLYPPLHVVRWARQPSRGGTNRRFEGSNPDPGATLHYSLPTAAKQASLTVYDIEGQAIRTLRAPTEAGLHRVVWDLMAGPAGGRTGLGGAIRTGRGPAGDRGRSDSSGAADSAKPADAKPDASKPSEEKPATAPAGTAERSGRGPGASGGGPGGGRGQGPRTVGPGAYRIVLVVDGREWSQTIEVQPDPNLPADSSREYYTEELGRRPVID